MTKLMETVTVTTALGCGLMGGVFFTFSAFVMPALKRLPPAQGAAAMQSINVTAVRPPLMIALFGTAALCLLMIVRGFTRWGSRSSLFLVLGGAIYLVGIVVMTAAFHVPLNDALAKVEPNSVQGAQKWHGYYGPWTLGNHLRAIAGIASSALIFLSLIDD